MPPGSTHQGGSRKPSYRSGCACQAKVASGAAETVPYFMVTNLARTLGELKERDIWCVGTSDDAPGTLYQSDLNRPLALVLGAEGAGMRQLTRKSCDELVGIPMRGAVGRNEATARGASVPSGAVFTNAGSSSSEGLPSVTVPLTGE